MPLLSTSLNKLKNQRITLIFSGFKHGNLVKRVGFASENTIVFSPYTPAPLSGASNPTIINK